MKIQFNDEATTLFEYPSEASLLDDQENVKPEMDVLTTEESSPLRLPIPFACSNLGSYTPSKVALSTDFELGITKTAPPIPPPKSSEQNNDKSLVKKEEENGDEEAYLRPADDTTTVSWSSGTTADLLF